MASLTLDKIKYLVEQEQNVKVGTAIPHLSDDWDWNYIDVDQSVISQLQHMWANSKDFKWLEKKALAGAHKTFIQVNEHQIQEEAPLLKKWLVDNGIFVNFMAVFVSSPYDDPDYIHVDVDDVGLSINFPIQSTADTTTYFYKEPEDLTYKFVDIGNNHVYIKCCSEKEFEVKSTYELTQPIIMRNDTPHRFDNPNATVRVCLTIRLNPIYDIPMHLIKEN
jgi:hypothetical protein